MKKALIIGATGQDGWYLSDFLANKGYDVYGVAPFLLSERKKCKLQNWTLRHGDVSDFMNIMRLIKEIHPDEIYNLAAQSHVNASFLTPESTANIDALGTLRVLEAMRILGLEKKIRYYQASSSEIFGKTKEIPQSEKTPFYPSSPYAVAKLYAYWITINYREAYAMFACNGILFNHESTRRSESFVTRKITKAVARIYRGLQDKLYLGNLDAKRDWGYAKEYVEAMWLMLQHHRPDDYVIATGRACSIREFVTFAFRVIDREIIWKGEGVEEKGVDKGSGKIVVEVDKAFFRPTEGHSLVGDASKAKIVLNWAPEMSLEHLVELMVRNDIDQLKSGLQYKRNESVDH